MYQIENNIYVKDTGIYGKSLFAKRDFKKNELVFVAFGPIITEPNLYTIPIAYEEKRDIFLHIEPRKPNGNLSQYICHSCEPNLGIKERTMFVAMQNINRDTEVTIDYAMIIPEFPEPAWKEWKDWKCSCGRKSCRGWVKGYFQLEEFERRKYAGYVSEFILEMEKSRKIKKSKIA